VEVRGRAVSVGWAAAGGGVRINKRVYRVFTGRHATSCRRDGHNRTCPVCGSEPTPYQNERCVAENVDFICTFPKKRGFFDFWGDEIVGNLCLATGAAQEPWALLLTQRRLRTQSSEAPARESVYQTLELRACASTRCRGGGSNKCAAKVPTTTTHCQHCSCGCDPLATHSCCWWPPSYRCAQPHRQKFDRFGMSRSLILWFLIYVERLPCECVHL
jgi:hypothetical protein